MSNKDHMKEALGIGNADDLEELLQRGACTMAFQPIIDLRSEEIYGFEALFRGSSGSYVSHPDRLFNEEGYLEKDLLIRLDTACVGSALRSGRDLAKKSLLFVNIHFSTLHYLSLNLSGFLRLAAELDVDPAHIVFEISERTDHSYAAEVEKCLRLFAKHGIRAAIDDIGGSFTWLHHMLEARPYYLKVDKSFIQGIETSKRKLAVVKGLHSMSREMGLHVIAEGIERPEEAEALNQIGVSYAQGFWLGRPQGVDEWVCQ